MVKEKNTPEEIEFIRNSIQVLRELNDLFKEIRGEDAKTREIDANIEALEKSIKDQIN